MHLRNSFISTTRCDDLARATEAQDGKKKTELSNLCGFQVQAVKKSCHAALVFSHGSGAPVILRVRGRR